MILNDNECNYCKSQKFKFYLRTKNCTYVECLDCGLVYINPKVKLDTLKEHAELFGEVFHSDKDRVAWSYSEFVSDTKYKPILKKLQKYGKKGKLLDVGCSNGAFLNSARNNGWETFGVEMAQKSAVVAKNNNLDVFVGTLFEAKYRDNDFDAVVLLQTFEHLPDPRQILEEVYRILKPGGVLYISVPNLNSLARILLREKLDQYFNIGHPCLYSKKSLHNILTRSGFKVWAAATIDIDPWYIINKLFNKDFEAEGVGGNTGNIVNENRKRLETKMLIKKHLLLRVARTTANIFISMFNLGDNLMAYSVKMEQIK